MTDLNKKIAQYCDPAEIAKFEFFLNKVSERTDKVFGLRPDYSCAEPALGEDVEYFGFNILQDDRMRYIIENIVTLPESKLSMPNKIGNTIISHFYGARGIHSVVTGVKNTKDANVDFELLAKDVNYLEHIKGEAAKSKKEGKKFYGTTELHTSLQTAARNFCRKKYSNPDRPASFMDILEWIASWTQDGSIDRIINTKSLEVMFNLLREKPGVGEYYGYHCATSNSVNPFLAFNHDERFCSPGPGAKRSLDRVFKKLKDSGAVKKLPYAELVIWLRENQKTIFNDIHIHKFFHNIEIDGKKIFEDEQDELKVYGTEVGLCQYGIFCHLKENPHLISKRKVARAEDDSVCDGATCNFSSNLLEF